MRRIAQALLGGLLAVAVAAPAAAADAGFGPVGTVGSAPVRGVITAAVTSDGRAAAAIAADSRVLLASRGDGAWRQQDVSGPVQFGRDAQVAVNRHGTVVAAWAETSLRRRQELVVAAGRAGGTVRVIARRRIARSSSAFPRLATLATERVLLTWRDGTTLRAAAVLGNRLGDVHTIARGAGALALAPLRSTALVAWVNSYAGKPARLLRAVQVQSAGVPVGRPLVVSRAVTGTPRVTGSPEPRALVSWVRAGTPVAAYTRQVAPFARPARPVVTDGFPNGAPAIDLAPDGSAALAQRVSAAGFTAFGIVSAHSQSGGVWTQPAPLSVGPPSFSVDAVALGARRSLTVWDVDTEIRAALRDASGAVTGTQTLTAARTVGGLAVAHGGSHVLVAYPAPSGGFAVAERTG